MKNPNFSHKVIAIFLCINFLNALLPYNILLANNNGPNAPTAAGFEPVDATDMVSLSTGNLSYVLPLMDVEGFPVSLSYHAGIPNDMEASWVGLGWYLTPGAINRTVTNTPDDWQGATSINFNSFYADENYYGISAELGLNAVASVGVGLNWGGSQAVSGSVNASLGLGAAMGGKLQGGLSASASTNGNASLGLGVGVSTMGVNAGASVSYSLQDQWNLNGGVGVNK